jgi:hypothetical protein
MLAHRALQIAEVLGFDRVGSWFGNVPSSSKYSGISVTGRPSKTFGTV